MHKLAVIAIALVLNPSLSASGDPAAGDDAVPVRNWQAPAYWVVPTLDDGTRSTRIEAPDAGTSTLATSTLAFVGITPCRVADTRQPPPGEFGQPWMQPSTVRSFTLTGQCAIPANAEAVSFNFTATNTAGAGFLLVYPAGGSVPGVSTLNYLAAQTIANAAVVPLGTLGAGKGISVIPGVAGLDLIIDVNGYYTAQGLVSSLNGTTGAVSITAGANVAVTPSGQNVQLSAGPLVSSLEGLTGVVDIATMGGATVSAESGTLTIGTTATWSDSPATIVARDGIGSIYVRSVNLTGTGDLLRVSSTRFMHCRGSNYNSFLGYGAGGDSVTGTNNSGFGTSALGAVTTGAENTALGRGALYANTGGDNNTAAGATALFNVDGGNGNSAFGTSSLTNLSTGSNNVAIGYSAGGTVSTGNNNVYIGYNVDAASAAESNTIRIGPSSATATVIRGISGTAVSGSAVYVTASGQLGIASSSARFKDEIDDLGDPSRLLLALRPVSFVYKADEARTPQAGLIAEEVEKVAPNLVLRDEKGLLLTVRYEQLVPMLLAEAQRLERENAGLRREMEARNAETARALSRLADRVRDLEASDPKD